MDEGVASGNVKAIGSGFPVPGKGPEEAAQPEGPASLIGTSSSRKGMVLFSISLISPLACAGIMFFAKDIYVLKFAADVGLMGVVSTLLAVLGPIFQPIVGFCMEKVPLSRFFPWETWGRRAPWFLTHSIGLVLCTVAVWLPPASDRNVLCLWYLCFAGMTTWFVSVLFNAVESARLEIYETKEKRSEVEAFIKISGGVGMGVGTGLPLLVAAGASWGMLVLASLVTLIAGTVSLISVPVLRKARVKFQADVVGTFFSEMCSLFQQRAVRHLVAYRFIEDGLAMLAGNTGLYYLTFVEGMVGAERSICLLLTGLAMGVSTVLLLPFWFQFLRVRRRGVNVNVVSSCVLGIGVLSPICLLVGEFLPPGVGFCGFVFIFQSSLTGQTFWRMIALGWVCDEDCHAQEGRRREAILVGIIQFASSVGRAIAVAITMLGLAFCGLVAVNCERHCADQGASAAEDCVDACEIGNALMQPEAVRTYLNVLYCCVMPLLHVIVTILVYTFPIHGERLDAIYEKQAQLYGSSPAQALSPRPDADPPAGGGAGEEAAASEAWPEEAAAPEPWPEEQREEGRGEKRLEPL